MRKIIQLNIPNGLYSDDNLGLMPFDRGLYFAYDCRPMPDGSYSIIKLLYIGISDCNTIASRIAYHFHNDHDRWKKYVPSRHVILYTAVKYTSADLTDIESALIFKNQPICNIQHKDRYNGSHPCPDIWLWGKRPYLRNVYGEEIDMINKG